MQRKTCPAQSREQFPEILFSLSMSKNLNRKTLCRLSAILLHNSTRKLPLDKNVTLRFQQRPFVAHAMQNTSLKLPSASAPVRVHADPTPLCLRTSCASSCGWMLSSALTSGCSWSLSLLTAFTVYCPDFSAAAPRQVKLTVPPRKARSSAQLRHPLAL